MWRQYRFRIIWKNYFMTILLNSEEIKKCVELKEQLIPIIEEAFKNLA